MISLALPEPPNLANARWHWRKKNRLRKGYIEEAWYMAIRQHRPPKQPPERVRIRAHLRLWNLRDDDNLTASLKWPIDALSGRYFVDDDPAHMEIESVTQEINRRNRGIDIMIEVLDD